MENSTLHLTSVTALNTATSPENIAPDMHSPLTSSKNDTIEFFGFFFLMTSYFLGIGISKHMINPSMHK